MIQISERDIKLAKISDFYKSKPAYQFKIKELTLLQREHLAWRLDHKTACGMITAGTISRMKFDWGEKTLGEVFENLYFRLLYLNC